jgi:hypothetical protein
VRIVDGAKKAEYLRAIAEKKASINKRLLLGWNLISDVEFSSLGIAFMQN